MKTIAALIQASDELTRGAHILNWALATFVEPRLAEAAQDLRTDCGFDAASKEAQRIWASLERRLSPADIASALIEIKLAGRTIEDFVNDLQQNPEASIADILRNMAGRSSHPPTNPPGLSGVWRN